MFDATRERMWQKWTERGRFADWFGGVDCGVPPSEISIGVGPGGKLRESTFCGPERRLIRWASPYQDVAAPDRLIFTITDQQGQLRAVHHPAHRPRKRPH